MSHPSRFELEQFYSGELDSPDVRQHVENCLKCTESISAMQLAQQTLLAQEPADIFISSLSKDTPPRPVVPESARGVFRIPVWTWSLAAAVLLCGLGFFVFKSQNETAAVSATTGVRWKGGAPIVEVFVHRSTTTIVSEDELIIPGDQVQYRVSIPEGKTGYTALIALENGNFTSVFPADERNGALKMRGTEELPESILIETDTKKLSLLLVVREENFRADELITEMQAAMGRDGTLEKVKGLVNIRRTVENTPGDTE